MRQRSLLVIIGILCLVSIGHAAASRQVIVKVWQPPLAWSSSGLGDKLRIELSRNPALRAVDAAMHEQKTVAFPSDRYNLDSLVNWGMEVGGRYLLLVDVRSERLEKRKTWHLPLVFHKYETIGVIEGELRLVDLARGKFTLAEPFQVRAKGARIFQATMDDDVNDPDIHLTAPAKVEFFDQLEDKLCSHIVKRVGFAARGR